MRSTVIAAILAAACNVNPTGWFSSTSEPTTIARGGGVMAFPSGAGQCLVGTKSVASLHVEGSATKTIKTGRLGMGRFKATVNGVDLSQPFKGMVHRVNVGTTYNVKVESTRAVPRGDDLWRGVLQAATPNVSTALFSFEKLSNDTTLQDASSCADPTIGITQTNSDRKKIAVARFSSMNASLFSLDANIVVANNASWSIYYYQQFKVRAVASCRPRGGSCSNSLGCCLGYACLGRRRSTATGNMTRGVCNFCKRSGAACANPGECCNGLTCRAQGGKRTCRAA
jgi:hypothetical protein